MQSDSRVVIRSVARAIVLDREREVLLMEMALPWHGGHVWIAPGGGLEAGETPEQGLRRELEEETGCGELAIGRLVWESDFVVQHEARTIRSHERYFLIETERFQPQPRALEAHEQAWFRSFRWWPLDEIASTDAVISPVSLRDVLARLR